MFALVAMLVIVVAVLLRNRFQSNFSCHKSISLNIKMAERTGFEPADVSVSGFQDQCLQPLGHLSADYYIILFGVCVDVGNIVEIINVGEKLF